ncbi:MAG: two-component regulator propeller domain-containing protein [Bacteroidota bacterium]|nr:two-component regulator propeller domain-containing protein [Bacteroidota bacterium]
MKGCLIIFFSLAFFLSNVSAQQNYAFQHITVEDGLLSNPDVNVYQDSQGFYWFASTNGIQRFDGQNFITYKFDYKWNKSSGSNWAGKPIEDNEKNIWVLNEEGINIFKRKEGGFSRLYMSDAIDSNNNNVAGIIKDKQNKIWIITSKNIFYYNYTLHKPVLYCSIIQDNNSGMYSPQYDSERNGLWLVFIGANSQIAYFDINKKQITYPFKRSVDQLLGHPDLISFFKLDQSNNLWFANYVGDLCKYNISNARLMHYSILHERTKGKTGSPNSTIKDCLDDGNGAVWFGGDYHLGLLKYDKKSDRFSQMQFDNGSEYGLHYNEIIYSFYKDRDGNIWINSDLGMNIFNPPQQQFKYLQSSSPFTSPFSTDVSSIFQSSSGDIWISTWGDGIFKYDSTFVLQKNYVHDKNNPASLGEPLSRTWCFSEDKKGNIWVGCQHGMISILDTATGKFTNKIIPEFNKSTVMHSIKDKKNNIWFGLYSGLIAKHDGISNKITVYNHVYKKSFGEVTPVDALYADENDNIWWGPGANGIKEFSDKKQAVIDTALYPLHASSISALNDSIIIGGTDTRGFFLFNKFTKSVRFFNTSNGLSTNSVYGGLPYKNNEVWIIANDGIEELNLPDGKIYRYNLNDGIRDHVMEGAFCKLKTGTIMAAAESGVLYFNPDSIKRKPPPADVVITAFNAGQHIFPVDSLLHNRHINLPYDQNEITIEYASLSFAGRKSNQYFYQLEGLDKTWISAGSNRSVTYANLSPGKYAFKIKSQNADGIETKHITTLSIIIHPPWWQTWWARLLGVFIASLIVYSVYDYRRRNRSALSNIRRKIATDLHDDIGSTLNSISVYSEVAGRQVETNSENAKALLVKMGDASRNMIDTMNDIVWSINPKNDQFENILRRMHYFAGELLSGKNILLHFDADENANNIKLSMAKRKNFYLIFKEAINNTYKYSEAKTVNVTVAQDSGRLVLIITDDGIGFESAADRLGGNGLKNMNARAKEIGAQLHIKSWVKKGTRIELSFPVK